MHRGRSVRLCTPLPCLLRPHPSDSDCVSVHNYSGGDEDARAAIAVSTSYTLRIVLHKCERICIRAKESLGSDTTAESVEPELVCTGVFWRLCAQCVVGRGVTAFQAPTKLSFYAYAHKQTMIECAFHFRSC